jgi:drug/metabolite transporter (DMT)-like permease
LALTLACLSALCFGTALVTAALGLRSLDARSGAAISIPTATLVFIATYPLVTVLLSAIFLRAEPLPPRAIAGILTSVAAVAYLVAG